MTSDSALTQLPDLEQRVAVLQTLGYVDEDKTVQLKGRVACEMNSADELLASELLFHNFLDALSAPEAVALLSAFVFQQKDASAPKPPPLPRGSQGQPSESGMGTGGPATPVWDPDECGDCAFETLNFGLLEVVLEWANGVPFADICTLTNVPRGSHCADHRAARRDVPRVRERSKNRWERLPCYQDGGGLGSHQAGHRLCGKPLHCMITRVYTCTHTHAHYCYH